MAHGIPRHPGLTMPRRHLAAGYRWWLSHACLRALGQRLIGRVGWQAALIAACAPVWAGYGAAALTGDAIDPPAGAPHLIVPATIRAVLWIAAAVLAVVQLWAPGWRRNAVAALAFMPVMCTGSYLLLAVGDMIPWVRDDADLSASLYGACRNLSLVGLVIVAALIPATTQRMGRP